MAVDVVGPEATVRTCFWVRGKERLADVEVFELGKVSYYGDENNVSTMAYIFH